MNNEKSAQDPATMQNQEEGKGVEKDPKNLLKLGEHVEEEMTDNVQWKLTMEKTVNFHCKGRQAGGAMQMMKKDQSCKQLIL